MDPLGSISSSNYDSLGRISATINPKGFAQTFIYDARNSQVAAMDAVGFTTTWVFDGGGRRVSRIDSLGNSSTATFDNNGNVICNSDALGYLTTIVLDGANRITVTAMPTGSRITYSHTPMGRTTGVEYPNGTRITHLYNPLGNRTTLLDAIGVSTFSYDGNSAMAARTDYGFYVQSRRYDAARQEIGLTEPTGFMRTYSYDLCGHVNNYLAGFSTWSTILYDSLERPTTYLYFGGMQQLVAYDSADRIASIINAYSGQILDWFTYSYDRNGNRIVAIDLNGSWSTFSYDAKDRLTQDVTSGTNAHTFGYQYDAVDNLVYNPESGASFTFDAAYRVSTSINTSGTVTSYFYDQAGNNTVVCDSAGCYSMTYDDNNHLTQYVSAQNGYMTYLYDGDGLKRIEREYNGLATLVYDGTDLIQRHLTPGATCLDVQISPLMLRGKVYPATITYLNSGLMPWVWDRNVKLFEPTGQGPFAPWDIFIPDGGVVGVGNVITFAFFVIAPASPGIYTFQYQMFCEEVGRFGDLTSLIHVGVG